jgi:predicted transcriptional regulator
MTRRSFDASDTELAILQVLWDHGESTIRQITDIIYPNGATAQYATVQKLLDRLDEKGLVSRRKNGSINLFSASVAREEMIGRHLENMAEKLCGGSLTPLLTHLVRSQRLSANERDELRALIDKHDDRKSNP